MAQETLDPADIAQGEKTGTRAKAPKKESLLNEEILAVIIPSIAGFFEDFSESLESITAELAIRNRVELFKACSSIQDDGTIKFNKESFNNAYALVTAPYEANHDQD